MHNPARYIPVRRRLSMDTSCARPTWEGESDPALIPREAPESPGPLPPDLPAGNQHPDRRAALAAAVPPEREDDSDLPDLAGPELAHLRLPELVDDLVEMAALAADLRRRLRTLRGLVSQTLLTAHVQPGEWRTTAYGMPAVLVFDGQEVRMRAYRPRVIEPSA